MSHSWTPQDRHIDVEHDQIRQRRGSQRLQPFLAGARGAHVVAFPAENFCECFYEVMVVIDQE